MLLTLKGRKDRCAIGLRWAVDTRSGIEHIQFNTNLNFGLIFPLSDKSQKKLKLCVLADEGHDRALCLAGLFSHLYKNLIFVHRLSDLTYWVCIIKSGEVWSGVDVAKATAGDFVDDYDQISTVIQAAEEDFTSSGINLSKCRFCTDAAYGDFPEYEVVDLYAVVNAAGRLKKKFTIRYLQPTKVIKQKIFMILVALISISVVSYYIHRNSLINKLLHDQEIAAQHRKEMQALAEKRYFQMLQTTLDKQWGHAVIANVMTIFEKLDMQSQGWQLAGVTYETHKPTQLALDLQRTSYGSLDSFIYAYTPQGKDGKLGKDNNSGTKLVTYDVALQTQEGYKIDKAALQQSIPRNLYRLISYMQLNSTLYQFQVKTGGSTQYKVHQSSFTLTGSKIWELLELQPVFQEFPTLVVTEIKFLVNGFDMSWELKGEIYG